MRKDIVDEPQSRSPVEFAEASGGRFLEPATRWLFCKAARRKMGKCMGVMTAIFVLSLGYGLESTLYAGIDDSVV